jgi:polysaccharide export outer membrane protein
VALVAGCAGLPTSGPTANEVVEQSGSGLEARFAIVDVDARVLETDRRRPLNSLFGSFGNRPGAPNLRIGVGDVISVSLWEAPPGSLFGNPGLDRANTGSRTITIPDQPVSRDGAITVPYAGRVPVVGRTPADVQRAIEQRLQGKAIEPQALVTVPRALSSQVTVSGEVTGGARVPLSQRGDRVMDMIAAAGGVRAPVHESFVRLSRGNTTATVPLQTIISNPRENIFVQAGDVITVVRTPQTFTAFGATGRNALVNFEGEAISLAEALGRAGGLLDFRADPEGVFLFRLEPEPVARAVAPNSPLVQRGRLTPVVYRFNMREAQSIFLAQSFRVRDKDVLYVSNAPLSEFQKFLQIIQSVTSPVVSGAAVAAATR